MPLELTLTGRYGGTGTLALSGDGTKRTNVYVAIQSDKTSETVAMLRDVINYLAPSQETWDDDAEGGVTVAAIEKEAEEMARHGWEPVQECPDPDQHRVGVDWQRLAIDQENRAEKAEQDRDEALSRADRYGKLHRECHDQRDKAWADLEEAEQERDEARALAQTWQNQTTDSEDRARAAEQDRDEWRSSAWNTKEELELDAREILHLRRQLDEAAETIMQHRYQQPQGLTADDLDDGAAHRATDEFQKTGSMRRALTAALTPPPARPEGAEALTSLIEDAMEAQNWRDDYETLADYLAERGVRKTGEQS